MYNSEIPQKSELPSASRLVRSTVVAFFVAAALLVTVVMPAEYGIDPTGVGRVLGLKAMGEIKMAAEKGASPVASSAAAPATSTASASAAQAPTTTAPAADQKTDKTTVTLKPGEGVEVKMQMEQGAKVQYRWATSGGVVSFDAHGEGSEVKFSLSYKKGSNAQGDEGMLEAAFKGQHGWYWKNRGKEPVTIELTTVGQYSSIQRVL